MNNTVHKWIAVAAALCLLVCAVPTVSADEDDEALVFDDFEYRVLYDGTVAITGHRNEENAEVILPSSIGGRLVTTIDEEAFEGCNYIHRVEIPEGVTVIRRSAFEDCYWLEEVVLPSTLKEIQDLAFEGCQTLKTIEFPPSLETLEAGAFHSTGVKEFYVPPSLTRLDSGTFGEAINIRVSPDNPKWCDVDGVVFSKDGTLLNSYPCGRKDSSYTVPDGVVCIESSAFQQANLKEIRLPQGLKTIEQDAFEACSYLASISLPESVTEIYAEAFENCCSLTNVRLPSGLERLESGAFEMCYSLYTVTIPVGITRISERTFYGCDELVDVHYEGTEAQWNAMRFGPSNAPVREATVHYESVGGEETVGTDYIYHTLTDGTVRLSAYIGNEATVNVPSQIDGRAVTALGRYAFCYTDVARVNVAEGVTDIGTGAFRTMENLTALSFPSSLKRIGQNVVDWNMEEGEPLTLKEVFYNGSEVMWKQIEIPDPLYASSPFGEIEIQYGSAPEDLPSEDEDNGGEENGNGGFPWGAVIAVVVVLAAAVAVIILKKRR